MRGFGDAYLVAVFHPAQLLELFDALEVTRGQRGEFEQRGAAKSVQAQMLHVLDVNGSIAIAHPWNRRAGKVQRIAVKIENHFDDVGIHDVGGFRDGHHERGD